MGEKKRKKNLQDEEENAPDDEVKSVKKRKIEERQKNIVVPDLVEEEQVAPSAENENQRSEIHQKTEEAPETDSSKNEIQENPAGFFSRITFDEIDVADQIKKALESMELKTLTEIQVGAERVFVVTVW